MLEICTFESGSDLCMGEAFKPAEVNATIDKDRMRKYHSEWPSRWYIKTIYTYGGLYGPEKHEETFWFCRECASHVLFYGILNQLRGQKL